MVIDKQYIHSMLDAVEKSQERSLELCKHLTKLEERQLFVVISLVLSVVSTEFLSTFFEVSKDEDISEMLQEAIKERKEQVA